MDSLHAVDFVSLATVSEFCETDNLPIPDFMLLSACKEKLPLVDFDSE